MIKKTIRILLFVILGIICVTTISLFIDPKLPSQTNEVIAEITSNKNKELVDGDSGYVNSGSTKIWYEIKNKSINSKGTVLLINGYTEPSTLWSQYLIKSIIDNGYQVIRFDNRDVGLSDWTENEHPKAYTIEDMINDAIAVLDQNGIDKAHILGYSMGGYIAQSLAIKYPGRVLSLTSLSSTADLNDKHPEFNWTPLPLIKLYFRYKLVQNDKSFLKYYFKAMENINGNDSYNMNLKSLGERGLYELHNRRGFNINAGEHQMTAIRDSEPIYNQLDKIKIPTLIVHGKKDPILSFELAVKYADKIEGAKKVWIDQAGHLITNDYVDQLRGDFFKILAERQN